MLSVPVSVPVLLSEGVPEPLLEAVVDGEGVAICDTVEELEREAVADGDCDRDAVDDGVRESVCVRVAVGVSPDVTL